MLQLMTIDQRNKYGTKLQLTKLSEKYLTMRVSERRVVVVNVVVVVVNSNLCQSSFFLIVPTHSVMLLPGIKTNNTG